MDSVYIDRKGTRIQVQGNRLLLQVPGQPRCASLPMTQIRVLVISSMVELSSTVLLSLSRNGVNVVLLNPMKPAAMALTLPYRHGSAARRLAQYAFIRDPQSCLSAAKELVRAKLISQYREVRGWRRRRPDLRYPLTRALRALRARHASVQEAADLDQLRGIEGAGASAHFDALKEVLPASWGFLARRRRPPPDPVNALLSLSYTMLHSEAMRVLTAAGLDPCLGFYHQLSYGRESLACDLVELLRAEIDAWVAEMIRDDVIRMDHLEHASGGCYLSKTGRGHYFPAWEQQARQWRRKFRAWAMAWAARLGDVTDVEIVERDDDDSET